MHILDTYYFVGIKE